MDDAHETESRPNPAPHLHETFVSHATYGLVTVLAVLEVMSEHPPSPWHAVLTLFGTTLAVALLDAYSASIAELISRAHNLTRDDLRRIWRDVSPVLIGAQAPTLLVALAGLGWLAIGDAIDLARAVAFLLLFGYGWRVGRILHEHWLRQLLSGLVLVAIGAFIVSIKAAFH